MYHSARRNINLNFEHFKDMLNVNSSYLLYVIATWVGSLHFFIDHFTV